MSFILGAKRGDHKYFFDWFNALEDDDTFETTRFFYKGKKVIRRTTQTIRYAKKLPLNDSNSDLFINFLELTEIVEKKVEKITHDSNGVATIEYDWVKEGNEIKFSWVTDLDLNENTVFSIMMAGRKRWAIENETFNTLKNQGYSFEHSYGHGKENLATNFAYLMMLAFLVDQVQELSCRTFQKVLKKMGTKKALWKKMALPYLV